MAKTKEEIKEPILTKAEIKAKAIETKKAEQATEYEELHDVIDTRTRQFHSVAVVKDAKCFVPVEEFTE